MEGYRAVGDFDATNWLIAKDRDGDVGCLIVASHTKERIWELVYMGIVPEARGHGFGLAGPASAMDGAARGWSGSC